MRMIVDGVAFQDADATSPAARSLWSDVLRALDADDALDIVALDRGGTPGLARGRVIPFPPRSVANDARDSILIQHLCDEMGAEVFLSTGCTTPLRTPSVALWTGEHAGEEPGRLRDEAATAVAFAVRIIAVNEAARAGLLADHPAADRRKTEVAAGQSGHDATDAGPETLAISLRQAAAAAARHMEEGAFAAFFTEWERLRLLQAEVDIR